MKDYKDLTKTPTNEIITEMTYLERKNRFINI